MKKVLNKFKRSIYSLAVLTGLLLFPTCTKESLKDRAREAAVEFCDCIKTKSKEKCLEELKQNYSGYGTDEFIDTFNSSNNCNAVLYRTKE